MIPLRSLFSVSEARRQFSLRKILNFYYLLSHRQKCFFFSTFLSVFFFPFLSPSLPPSLLTFSFSSCSFFFLPLLPFLSSFCHIHEQQRSACYNQQSDLLGVGRDAVTLGFCRIPSLLCDPSLLLPAVKDGCCFQMRLPERERG